MVGWESLKFSKSLSLEAKAVTSNTTSFNQVNQGEWEKSSNMLRMELFLLILSNLSSTCLEWNSSFSFFQTLALSWVAFYSHLQQTDRERIGLLLCYSLLCQIMFRSKCLQSLGKTENSQGRLERETPSPHYLLKVSRQILTSRILMSIKSAYLVNTTFLLYHESQMTRFQLKWYLD